jgi:hypothetical protein
MVRRRLDREGCRDLEASISLWFSRFSFLTPSAGFKPAVFQAALRNTAAIEPTNTELPIKIAPLSPSPRFKVLAALCEALNKIDAQFPGSELKMRFSAEQCPDS